MEVIFLSSIIPYILVFGAMVVAMVLCFRYRAPLTADPDGNGTEMPGRTVTKQLMYAVSGHCIFIALFEIVAYLTVGTECIWWCTGKELGFFAKLLRAVPLILFLACQLLQILFYKQFMENYLKKDLSVKPTAIGFLCVLPLCIILYIVLSCIDVTPPVRDMIFYVALGVLMVVAIGISLFRNIKMCGPRTGLIFTSVTSILLWAALISLLLFVAAIIQLLFQTLIIVVGLYFAKSVFKGFNNQMIYTSSQKTVYRDMNGDLHYTRFGAEQANEKISRK